MQKLTSLTIWLGIFITSAPSWPFSASRLASSAMYRPRMTRSSTSKWCGHAIYQWCSFSSMHGINSVGPMLCWPIYAKIAPVRRRHIPFGLSMNSINSIFRRCRRHWKTFNAWGWIFRLCFRAAHVLRSAHVHQPQRYYAWQHILVMGLRLGRLQSNRKRMANPQMVFGDIQKLSKRKTRYIPGNLVDSALPTTRQQNKTTRIAVSYDVMFNLWNPLPFFT